MKKIIFTEQDKAYIQEQLKNLEPNNIVDLDQLILQTKTEEDRTHETYYYNQSTHKNICV